MIIIPDKLRRPAEVEREELRKQLAEARAEIERKNEELDMFLAEQRAMNEIIERKNALIEQMREALSLILEGAIHDFHYSCQLRDNCLCWGCQKKRVKAALSAAESKAGYWQARLGVRMLVGRRRQIQGKILGCYNKRRNSRRRKRSAPLCQQKAVIPMQSDGIALMKDFTDARQALYDHVGFVDDWVVYPIHDNTNLPWCIVAGEYVKYADDMDGFMSEGKYYEDSVYKRYYPKAIYEGKDLTMVILDTHTDGMKYFAFFANKNRVD